MEIEDEKDYDLWTEKYKPKTTIQILGNKD